MPFFVCGVILSILTSRSGSDFDSSICGVNWAGLKVYFEVELSPGFAGASSGAKGLSGLSTGPLLVIHRCGFLVLSPHNGPEGYLGFHGRTGGLFNNWGL